MNIAFIPVRGGSKSIPLKNIKPFAGKPLVVWTVTAADNAKNIDKVVVATDCQKIKDYVMSLHLPKVSVFDRNSANATDTASTESVMLEFLQSNTMPNISNQDNFVLIQATSPLLTNKMLDDMLNLFAVSGKDSALSAVRNKRFFWDATGTPINYDYKHRPRRQDFGGCLMENGAVYINKIDNVLKDSCRLSGDIFVYEMPSYMGSEIDEPEDWIIMEKLFFRYQNENFVDKKTFCFDIDGVLGEKTDIKEMNNDYANNTPNIHIIEICNKLYDSGHTIVIQTARGSGTGTDWSKKTQDQLQKWGVKYHKLHFGKPPADYYIDDKMLDIDDLRFFIK